jgi:predicted lipoprotein
MKNLFFAAASLLLITVTSCNKASTSTSSSASNFDSLITTALVDFTNNSAISGYSKLSANASILNSAIQTLNATSTDDNLATAKTAWLNMRQTWEQCEGFLFGPIEDNDYDPNMDTWPTDYNQMDSLLASSNALEVSDIQNLTLSLRGFHPIEYLIFGNHGSRKAADLTARQKKYMISLATDLTNTCNALYLSWTSAPTNFAEQVTGAGTSNSKYAKKQDVYMAIVGAMSDICDEVGASKMKEPFEAKDSFLVESPYSGNSLTDFKNNIIGAQNVYLGVNGGKGLKDLVAAKNKSLDNTIQAQFTAAINSFNNITVVYEEAIFTQRTQVQQTMDALATLQSTIENQLVPFVQQNILN